MTQCRPRLYSLCVVVAAFSLLEGTKRPVEIENIISEDSVEFAWNSIILNNANHHFRKSALLSWPLLGLKG